MLVIGAFTSVAQTLGNISSTFVAVDQHTTFLDDYFSFLAIDPLVPVPARPRTLPPGADRVASSSTTSPSRIRAAPSRRWRTSRSRFAAASWIALVGENGAGKSTLVKLLLRFYDADRGSVRVGGVDLKELDPEELRSRIGVLFQDYASYELSVRENVVMGRPGGAVDDERVLEALRDSRSEWLVKKMPNGLDSKVGRLFEGGHDLSGGEWQRLALARIMYRDADIWILDEPTSSLDPEAEAGDLRGAEGEPARPHRHRHLAPVLDGAHRRSDRGDRGRPRHGARHRTTSCCRPAAATRSSSSCRRLDTGSRAIQPRSSRRPRRKPDKWREWIDRHALTWRARLRRAAVCGRGSDPTRRWRGLVLRLVGRASPSQPPSPPQAAARSAGI